jgi:hypothetical protein
MTKTMKPARFINGKLEPIKLPSKAKGKIARETFIIGQFGNSETLNRINDKLRNKPKPSIEQWVDSVLDVSGFE